MSVMPMFPGFDFDCTGESSIWTDWVAPGCTEVATPGGTIIKDSVLAPFVEDFKNGVSDATKSLVTFWVDVPDPNVGDPDTGAPSDIVAFLQSSLLPLVGSLMVLAIIYGCAKIAWDGKNAGEEFRGIVGLLIKYILTAALAVPVIAGSLIIAKAFSVWIIDQSTVGTNFTENLFALFKSDAGITSAGALLVVLVIGVLVALVQCGVMIARGAALLILTGTILVTVSTSNTPAGKQAFSTHLGWLAGFIAYQPAAAIVYAGGFRLIGTNTNLAGNGLLQCIYGIVIMLMAILALPAIMRLVVPMVSPVASGRGVGAAVAGAATTLAITRAV